MGLVILFIFNCMDTTIFLAQIWGPVILAVALGVFVSRQYYIKIYKDLEKNALAGLLFAMGAMAVGIVHVNAHSVWGTLPEIIVSFLGWALLVKGALFAISPGFVDRVGDWWVNNQLIAMAGVLMLVVGGYLTWVGYAI